MTLVQISLDQSRQVQVSSYQFKPFRSV